VVRILDRGRAYVDVTLCPRFPAEYHHFVIVVVLNFPRWMGDNEVAKLDSVITLLRVLLLVFVQILNQGIPSKVFNPVHAGIRYDPADFTKVVTGT